MEPGTASRGTKRTSATKIEELDYRSVDTRLVHVPAPTTLPPRDQTMQCSAGKGLDKVDVTEVYSPPRVVAEAQRQGPKGTTQRRWRSALARAKMA